MKAFSRSLKTIVATGAAVGILALGGALPALAAGGAQSSSVIIGSGALGTGTVSLGNFSAYTLGAATMPTASWSIDSFTDARGTGPGWHINLTMSQLTAGSSNTLPVGSIVVTTPASVASGLATGITFPATVLDSGAVSLVSAAVDAGLGTFTFNPMTVTLNVPITAKIDTYTSNATVSTVATP